MKTGVMIFIAEINNILTLICYNLQLSYSALHPGPPRTPSPIILCLDSSDLIISLQLSHIRMTIKIALSHTHLLLLACTFHCLLCCLALCFCLGLSFWFWLFAACPDRCLLLDCSFFLALDIVVCCCFTTPVWLCYLSKPCIWMSRPLRYNIQIENRYSFHNVTVFTAFLIK